jgi:LacI family transcriptional regulator
MIDDVEHSPMDVVSRSSARRITPRAKAAGLKPQSRPGAGRTKARPPLPRLKTRSTTVMIVAPDGPFTKEVLEGVFAYSHADRDWTFQVCSHAGECSKELKENPPCGVLVIDHEKVGSWLSDWHGPLVSIEWSAPATPLCVHIDQFEVGVTGCSYFVNRGFRTVCHVGMEGDEVSRLQGEGVRKAGAEAGINTQVIAASTSQFRWIELGDALRSWRKSTAGSIGVVAANGEMALLVYQACRNAGLVIPEDIAVLGVRMGTQWETLCHPPLSRIVLPAKLAGSEGAHLLDRALHAGGPLKQIKAVRAYEISERASTRTLACEDPVAARIQAYVRAHAHEPIRVSDLASISGMSRRSLEKHLKRVLGRTVFDIIRGQQLAHARRLIEHSDRPLEDIVDHTAFSSSSHLTREFIKKTGLAPGAYRKATRDMQKTLEADAKHATGATLAAVPHVVAG